MKKIRVGVIGVGYLGKFHAEKYSRMKDVKLVGVVDIDNSRAENVAAALGTCALTDYRDLFGSVDAVSVVVPTEAHFTVGAACLNHDVDVLIEKPMTTRLEQADELIKIAGSKHRILQIGHLERFNPAVMALKDIVHNPMFIEAHRLSLFKDRSTDVSVVLDLMIHDIDIIMNVVKSEIKSIHAAGVPSGISKRMCGQCNRQPNFNQESKKNQIVPERYLCIRGFCRSRDHHHSAGRTSCRRCDPRNGYPAAFLF
jgi:predicted dehydrogenase